MNNYPRRKFNILLLPMLVGFGLIIFGWAVDYIFPGSQPGFGSNQLVILLIGVLMVAGDMILLTPLGQRYFQKWVILLEEKSVQVKLYQHIYVFIWFGLLTGLFEACIYAGKVFLFHRTLLLSPDIFWMAPLADIIVFSISGLLLMMITRISLSFIPLQLTLFSALFLSAFSLLLFFSSLSHLASALLALGIAIQATRMIVPRAVRFLSIAQSSMVWLVAVIVFLVVSMEIYYP